MAICRASGRRGKKRWSDSSLQVEDPKASVAPTCLAITCATFPSSVTILLDHDNMNHELSERRSTTSARDHDSEPQPSSMWSERSRTVTQSSQLVAAPLSCCACGTANSESREPCSHRVRPWVPRWPSGLSTATLRDDFGLPHRPAACPRRTQRWGHGYGRLGRYEVACRAPKHV